MADANHGDLTTALIPEEKHPGETPSTTDEAPPASSAAPGLQWHHGLSLTVLSLATLGAIAMSIHSVWKLSSVTLTFATLLACYRLLIYPSKPDALTAPDLISHIALSAIVAPCASVTFMVFAMLAFVLACATVFGVFFVLATNLYADQLQTLSILLNPLPANPTNHITALSLVADFSMYRSSAVWDNIGSSMGKESALLLLILAFVVLSAGFIFISVINEYIKWMLFQCYEVVSPNGIKASVNALGVSGLVFFACTGAFAFAFGRIIITAYSNLYVADDSFFTFLWFLTSSLVGTAKLVGTQIAVAVAQAEVVVLGKDSTLWQAFRTSALYCFVISILSIRPSTNGSMAVDKQPVATLLVCTALQVFILYRFTSRFVARMNSALSEEACAV